MFRIKFIALAAIVACSTQVASAQTEATQKYTVTVPSAISITAPTAVSLTHDESDNDQSFPAQTWVVKGNSNSGVTATFETATAFTHTNDDTFKRNAALAVAINSSTGGATWSVVQQNDTTDYEGNDEVASVQVSSDNFGNANIDLTVTFITDNFGTFLAGNYETTVTGTVTAN